ncbi:MAG: UDP-N-acetylmuramoyl-L-alanyl-D-glutamate--2 6-diaminopimelate ligase [Nitrospirae bacterium]|nr:MAG: UDP-N-acetylmuramoyl-L-alanyl-D-glutamate--2 6-diaminopimelate ligase [Nitrospirota bacterium]
MKFKVLIKDMEIKEITGSADIDVIGVAYDSRKVKQGDVFVAMKGEKVDGHGFINDAVKRGAAAVVYEKVTGSELKTDSNKLTAIKVNDSRKALAYISNNFYERPSDELAITGVTGTNGKTTTTYLLKSILEAWGKEVGLIGTINYIVKDRHYDAPHTTPEAPEFQAMLSEMLLAGCSHVVTEVSSHALAQRRVDYTNFDVAVFTNLTRDHLDFHATMEDYFRAKERLFKEILLTEGTSVINYDDVWGRKLIGDISGKVLTYGLEAGADMAAVNIKDSFEGLVIDIKFGDRIHAVKSPLAGMHNVYNILSAAGAAVSLNVPWDVIIDGIRKMSSVKGRFEKVDAGQDFLCIVDYAHTEDALERLIYTARELMKSSEARSQKSEVRQQRIITVFGCGGNRDKGKRPVMGKIATSLSDYVVITSDNPRDEDPGEIIKEIESGASRRNYVIEPDRREAIIKAVKLAEAGDILLVAGKGHEDYQEIKGIRHKFSDREALEDTIRDRTKNV